MKKLKLGFQIVIGFASILLLWCVGACCYDYTFSSFDVEVNPIFDVLPNIVLLGIFALLLIFAFIGKRKGFKALYLSALLSTGLPMLAFILSHIFNDDGNILCWIYGFTLGLILHPFHRLAWSTFDGVWLGEFGFNPELCAVFLIVGIVLSFIIYKFVRIKTKEDVITRVTSNDNNQSDNSSAEA